MTITSIRLIAAGVVVTATVHVLWALGLVPVW